MTGIGKIVAFRVDASLEIGTGHVMRCLTLADGLAAAGLASHFICRNHKGHLADLISRRGHQLHLLESGDAPGSSAAAPAHAAWLGTNWEHDATQTLDLLGIIRPDWLVVDHYALDRGWEQAQRPLVGNIMVIDDLADRPHDCDLLLDQNLGRSEQDYEGLLRPGAHLLVGPRYALLRPEFAQLRAYSLARRAQPQCKRLLVTMGGVDKDNATGQVLGALAKASLPAGFSITVVMGSTAPWLEQVRELAGSMPCATEVLVNVTDMADLMAESDLAIGAAGATSWERSCLGLPCIMLVLADNQLGIAREMARAGAAVLIDGGLQLASQLIRSLNSFVADPEILMTMSRLAANLVDGKGGQRVISRLES